jgi:predicted CoA-substrate-specific enzyme activase
MDAGSRTVKAVLFDGDEERVIGSRVVDQGVRQSELAQELFGQVMSDTGVERDDVAIIVATGYGRDRVAFADTTITEITCHAAGVRSLVPDVRTVVDIGGQDSKLVRLDADGNVRDFMLNDRCAAGTGRFLELVAERLEVQLDDLGAMAEKAHKPVAISSMCAVFAETEIVGLLASGVSSENIVAGVQAAIASRIASMAGRRLDEPLVFTGGVAMISGMDGALASSLGCGVTIVPTPRLTGALGAAILGARRAAAS